MPADYRIDVPSGCVFSRANGVLTDAEILAHQARLTADPLFAPGMDQLLDFRDLEGVEVGTETVRRLVAGNPFGEGSRRAAIAANPLVYGLARMFQTLSDETPDTFKIFESADAAREWLGLGDEPGSA